MYQSFDPDRSDFAPYGLSVTRWQPTPMYRTDRHNELELNFILTSPVTFQIGGQRIAVPAGRLMAFWAAIPHKLVDPVCNDVYYVATIPLITFLSFELPEKMVQAILNGSILTASTEAVLPAAEPRLDRWIDDLESGEGLRRQAAVLELQSLLLRIWSANKLSPALHESTWRAAVPKTDVSAVERMAAYIAQHYTEPLTVDQISKEVGLASGYAMTLFRKVFGQTLIQSLLDHRLAHAQRLLISTEMPILDIAYESGFGSLSRFNTAFKQHCSCAPRQYRNDHRT